MHIVSVAIAFLIIITIISEQFRASAVTFFIDNPLLILGALGLVFLAMVKKQFNQKF